MQGTLDKPEAGLGCPDEKTTWPRGLQIVYLKEKSLNTWFVKEWVVPFCLFNFCLNRLANLAFQETKLFVAS